MYKVLAWETWREARESARLEVSVTHFYDIAQGWVPISVPFRMSLKEINLTCSGE